MNPAIEPAEPSDFVKEAIRLLDADYAPRFADLRRRCAEAAMVAAPRGALAVREAVEAVSLEDGK